MEAAAERARIRWNLRLAEREAECEELRAELGPGREAAAGAGELDILAEQEGGLLGLSRDLSLTSQTVRVGAEYRAGCSVAGNTWRAPFLCGPGGQQCNVIMTDA